MEGIKLHIGCGSVRLNGFINIDRMKTNATDRVMNATQIDYGNRTVSEIYSCHMLEHLNKKDAIIFLAECARVLEDDGILNIEIPYLPLVFELYREGEIGDQEFINNVYGQQRHPGDFHKYGYTIKTLRLLLNSNGLYVENIERGRTGYGPNSPGIKVRAIRIRGLTMEKYGADRTAELQYKIRELTTQVAKEDNPDKIKQLNSQISQLQSELENEKKMV